MLESNLLKPTRLVGRLAVLIVRGLLALDPLRLAELRDEALPTNTTTYYYY